MKIIDAETKIQPDGRRLLVVELEEDEDLCAIVGDGFYRLGHGAIVPGHMITARKQVFWHPINQCWEEV
jgi:hypothetical protein